MLYDLCVYFICFMFFGFLGWCYECVFYSMQLKRLVNSGFLRGCICPVYGFGGLLLTAVSGRTENGLALFFGGMIICSLLEYFISWLLEYLFDARWWDYSDWPLNINGRVCAVSMLGFGFASVLGVNVIIPLTFGFVTSMPANRMMTTAFIMAALLFADLIYTVRNIDAAQDKLWFIEEHSKLMEKRNSDFEEKIESLKNFIRNR